MRKIFWVLTLGSTVLGGCFLVYSVVRAVNQMQELIGIAISLAITVIPYIFTRCLEGMRRIDVMPVRIVGPDRPHLPPERPILPERHGEAVPHPAAEPP